MFSRCFAIPKQCKTNKFLNLGLARWANCGLPWLCSSVALGGYLGAGRGFPGASALIVHQHTKIARLRLFGAIAFLNCLQISVLRGFLGGFFGFIGARCVFGCLVAFVGFMRLYACRVKRLEVRKRNAAHFIGFLGLHRSCICLYCVCCFACIALVLRLSWLCALLGLCWCWLSFPIGQNEKGAHLLCAPSLLGFGVFYFKLSNAIIASL